MMRRVLAADGELDAADDVGHQLQGNEITTVSRLGSTRASGRRLQRIEEVEKDSSQWPAAPQLRPRGSSSCGGQHQRHADA